MTGQRHLALSTRTARDSLIRNHVRPYFGSKLLVRIDHSDVQGFISELEAKGLSRSTIRQAYLIASGVLEAATNDGVIPRNPCGRRIRLPKETGTEHRYLTAGQVAELVEATDPRYRVMVLSAAYTGLRLGEVSALRVSDLDLLRRSLTVRRALSEVHEALVFGDPKSTASRRQVSLPAFLVDELGAHLVEYPPGTDGLIYTDSEGGPIRRTNCAGGYGRPRWRHRWVSR